MTRFTHKVALITGANSGIGKATARLFAQEGARVALLGHTEQEVYQTAEEFKQAGHQVMPLVADISQIDENTERRNLETVGEPVEYPEGAIPLTDGVPGQAEQVGQLVLFLASDAASHITGTEIWVDGGQSLLQG